MPSIFQPETSIESLMGAVRCISGACIRGDTTDPPQSDARQLGEFADLNLEAMANGESRPPLPPEELSAMHERRTERYGEVTRSVESMGIEALAWYRSFHIDGLWGIYIKESSLHYLADTVLGSHDHAPASDRLYSSWIMLWAHEIFHFATDLAIARWEIVLQRPLWAFDQFRRREESVSYWRYEEQAANAQMLRHLGDRWSADELRQVEAFTRRQPPGYRDAHEAGADDRFLPLLEELMRAKIGLLGIRAVPDVLIPGMSAAAFLDLDDQALGTFYCPVYLVEDASTVLRPPITERIIACIPEIVESKRFEKMLNGMHPDFKKLWSRKKAELTQRIPGHPEFEKFSNGPPPIFSLRLNRGARVHLQMPDSDGSWMAISVGQHKEMGHG